MGTAFQDPTLAKATETTETQIAELLNDNFGEDLSYHPRLRSNFVYKLAVENGYLDTEGYLTRKGRALMNRYGFI